MAHAFYLAPDVPLGACNEAAHVGAYVQPYEAADSELAAVLHAYMVVQQLHLSHSTALQMIGQATKAAAAATMANNHDFQPALEAQLAQLTAAAHEPRPPLTLAQLRFEASAAVVRLASLGSQYIILGQLLELDAGRELDGHVGDVLNELSDEARRFADVMQRLQPSNPKTLLALAMAAELVPRGTLRALRLYLLMHSLAEQRWASPYWAALSAMRAQRQLAACGDEERRHPEFERLAAATVAAGQQAARALRQCRRMLPSPWLQQLEAEALQEIEAQPPAAGPRAVFSGGGSSTSDGSVADAREQGSMQRWIKEHPQADSSVCCGCGQRAVGLRACARCKQARYCSIDCQMGGPAKWDSAGALADWVAAWLVHAPHWWVSAG